MDKSPQTLAFLGDAVITLRVRELLADKSHDTNANLHKRASSYENAANQARVFDLLELTEHERDLASRAHNAKVNTKAKNFSLAEYRRATALEALVGFWHLHKQMDKVDKVVALLMYDYRG